MLQTIFASTLMQSRDWNYQQNKNQIEVIANFTCWAIYSFHISNISTWDILQKNGCCERRRRTRQSGCVSLCPRQIQITSAWFVNLCFHFAQWRRALWLGEQVASDRPPPASSNCTRRCPLTGSCNFNCPPPPTPLLCVHTRVLAHLRSDGAAREYASIERAPLAPAQPAARQEGGARDDSQNPFMCQTKCSPRWQVQWVFLGTQLKGFKLLIPLISLGW